MKNHNTNRWVARITGLVLLANRIERRRACWTIEAIRIAINGVLPLEYHEAREETPEAALAKFNLEAARIAELSGGRN